MAEGLIALEWPTTTALRFMSTGGDTLHHYPPSTLPFTLINNYGPTEATVVATYGPVPSTPHASGLPSIGRPIANTQIYILDEQLRQVPPGEPGELHIGGIGLAKGYLNRPELTAEKFIPHPFSSEPGARLYKTGDLARYRPDGQIEFLGRNDQQVKIRGYRIELNEIVTVLKMHPAIKANLVVAREDNASNKRLVAYIVLLPGFQPTASSLRNDLLVHLPEYMVPSTFVVLDAFPLTSSRKIDRALLPAPTATNILRDEALAAPTTPAEERLVAIMASVLGLEQVGIDDNFFALGGHSLLAAKLVTQINSAFTVELPLSRVFDLPTVRLLAIEIEQLLVARLESMSEEEIMQLLQSEQSFT
jgi:acyl-CoA synthetase (AMP-forming)/AMP-acid ligase II/acyl carrier protein